MARSRRRLYGDGSVAEYMTTKGVRWKVWWYEPVDPDEPNGARRRRVKAAFESEKAAGAFLRNRLVDVGRGEQTKKTDKLTLNALMDEFLASHRVAPGTKEHHERMFRLHVRPYIGNMLAEDLRPTHLSALYKRLGESGNRRGKDKGGPLGPSTILKVHTYLSTMLKGAVEDRIILRNPAATKRAMPPTPSEVRTAKPEIHWWTDDEVSRFEEWCNTERGEMSFCWILMLRSGIRRGEALGLQWRDVDFKRSTVAIRRARVETNTKAQRPDGTVFYRKGVSTVPTKNLRARSIKIDQDGMQALRDQFNRQAEIDPSLVGAHQWVFTKITGEPCAPNGLWERFTAAVARFNRLESERAIQARTVPELLTELRLHDLRHTHATMWLEQGGNMKYLQHRLGHETYAMTSDLYSHVGQEMQDDGVEKVQENLRRRREERKKDQATAADPLHSDIAEAVD